MSDGDTTKHMKYFDIDKLIKKGKENVREYELPQGTVYIRPLTEIEMNEAETMMFTLIKDPKTRDFVAKLDVTGKKKSEDADYSEVDTGEMFRAQTEVDYYVALYAMRDFTEGLTIDKVKQLYGIPELADEVRRISGFTEESLEDVENFR